MHATSWGVFNWHGNLQLHSYNSIMSNPWNTISYLISVTLMDNIRNRPFWPFATTKRCVIKWMWLDMGNLEVKDISTKKPLTRCSIRAPMITLARAITPSNKAKVFVLLPSSHTLNTNARKICHLLAHPHLLMQVTSDRFIPTRGHF